MGIVLYAMMSGFFPFSAKTYPDLYKKIIRGSFRFPDDFSASLRDLLTGLLCYDPNKRLTASAARNHPWVRKYEPVSLSFTPCAVYTVSKDARMDLYKEVVARMTALGVVRDELLSDVSNKRRNSLTSCYYLLAAAMGMRIKAGGIEAC